MVSLQKNKAPFISPVYVLREGDKGAIKKIPVAFQNLAGNDKRDNVMFVSNGLLFLAAMG